MITRHAWTLVYRPTGRFTHVMQASGSCPVVWRFVTHGSESWLGTGSQEEYDIARRGELCPACKRYLEMYE